MKGKNFTASEKTAAIKNLLFKELFFAVPLPVYLFCLTGALALIPSYPAIVSTGYCFLAIFISANIQRANRDIEFTAVLPVRRNDIVIGKAAFVVVVQLMQLLIAGICAAIADYVISPGGNITGFDANLAFFGVVALGYGVFNVIYLPGFFKTGYKAGKPVLLGLFAFLLVYAAAETTVQLVPALRSAVDTLDFKTLWLRAVIFAAGAVAYGLLTFTGVKTAQKRFDKISL